MQCSSAASPFVTPLWAGFVVSLFVYCASPVSVHQGDNMCVDVIFSVFLGMSFMILCIVDSLNLFGMPGFLLVGMMGRGGGVASCPSASRCRCAGSHSCTGFIRSVFLASCAAACCFIWFSWNCRGRIPDLTCIACIGVVLKTGSIVLRHLFCMPSIFFICPFLLFHPTGKVYDNVGSMQALYKVFMFWWLRLPFVLASICRHPAAAAPWLVRCCMCCLNESLESNMRPSHLMCGWGS